MQGSNLGLLHCRQILYDLSHRGRNCQSYHLLMPWYLSVLGSFVLPGHFSWAVSFPRGLDVGFFPHGHLWLAPWVWVLVPLSNTERKGRDSVFSSSSLPLHPLLCHKLEVGVKDSGSHSPGSRGAPHQRRHQVAIMLSLAGINRKTDSPGLFQLPVPSLRIPVPKLP